MSPATAQRRTLSVLFLTQIVGEDHAQWLGAEKGALGLDALRALKAKLDPAGVMNPGKLLAL